MDPASPANSRLREIVSLLSSTPGIDARQRSLLDEAKKLLAVPTSITIRHDPATMPEPSVVSLQTKEGDR